MTDTDDTPLDLGAVGPARPDAARLDSLAARIAAAAAPELARRRDHRLHLVLGQVARWRRPLLATSALAASFAGFLIVRAGTTTGMSTDAPSRTTATSLAESLGVPSGMAAYAEGRATSISQALYSTESR